MIATINGARIELVQGDITQEQVDAIVNAANSRLAGGGGVDGAIHRAAGPEIMRETSEKYPDGCPTGAAVISAAGRLAAKFVIHAVGPVWHGGAEGEAELLASAHRHCLQLAVDNQCESVAFPAISTGVYAYPLAKAAEVALQETIDFLQQQGHPQVVRFVLFNSAALQQFASVLTALTTPGQTTP